MWFYWSDLIKKNKLLKTNVEWQVFLALFDRRMAAAEVNGSSAPAKEEEEPMDVTTTHTENYQTLIDAGLPQKVAESLDNIFQTGG